LDQQPRPSPPEPGVSADTQFFWDGIKAGRLLIQRCTRCGTLRHPPGPVCVACHSLEWDSVEASGRGTLFTFVVVHYPRHPAFAYPHPVGLVELEEGTRLVAPLANVDCADLKIGMPLKVLFPAASNQNRLPAFEPRGEGRA
jgi:uncharacterized OB-fold protein